jgi:O-antigen/teichoic acid export membrane protein
MNQHIRILRNTVALAFPYFVNPFISFVLIIMISRYLGVEGLGQYSLIQSYLSLFGTLASLGLTTLIVREVSRRPDEIHVFLFNATLFGLVSSLISITVMDTIVASMGYPQVVVSACIVASVSLIMSTTISYLEGVLRSSERSEYIALAYLVETVLKVAICVLLLLLGYGIIALFVVFVGTRFVALLFMFRSYVRTSGKPVLRLRRDIWLQLTREAVTFASIAIFSGIHLGIDQIILSKLKTLESVGIYSAADRLMQICKALPLAFAAAVLPFLTREHASGAERLPALAGSCLRYVLMAMLPIAVGTAILADEIVSLIYGTKFFSAGSVLRLHIFSILPMGTVFILAEVLIVTDNQKVDLLINIVAACVNVVLCFLFIPYLSEIGAALAVLVTMIIFCGIQIWYIRRRLFNIPILNQIWKPLVATAGMGIVTSLLMAQNLILNVVISAIVYFLLLNMLKALTPEETTFLKGIKGLNIFRKP